MNLMFYTITFHVEYCERSPQEHSVKYDWLGLEPRQNTQGWLYPYITASFNYSSHGTA